MKRIGKQTLEIEKGVFIIGRGSLVGEKEKMGAFRAYMQNSVDDDKLGEETFEKGERKMLRLINKRTIKDAKINVDDIDLYLGGDLMNQLVSSNYVAGILQTPFVGIYSACSTITASIGIAAALIDAGGFNNILCSTISHFSSAERQYRYPLEFGNQRQSYSQWTVTAGGGFVLSNKMSQIKVKQICFGRVQDFGVVDIANMGAAMAPAACDTLCNYFDDTKTQPDDYDLIVTGDLGKLGSDILRDLILERGYNLKQNYIDLGHAIYLFDEEAYQGGSGAGCSASVLSTYIIDKMLAKKFKKVLVAATGALMSTVSNQQGDSIPGVSHLIELEYVGGKNG
ncbi:MAG: stage V sporulation protein AD [Clostridia bacterium]|nr:stage V sporulation protein AD [Clostridia bacterium]